MGCVLTLLGCNNEEVEASKHCFIYGGSHPTSKLINSHRILIKVLQHHLSLLTRNYDILFLLLWFFWQNWNVGSCMYDCASFINVSDVNVDTSSTGEIQSEKFKQSSEILGFIHQLSGNKSRAVTWIQISSRFEIFPTRATQPAEGWFLLLSSWRERYFCSKKSILEKRLILRKNYYNDF